MRREIHRSKGVLAHLEELYSQHEQIHGKVVDDCGDENCVIQARIEEIISVKFFVQCLQDFNPDETEVLQWVLTGKKSNV